MVRQQYESLGAVRDARNSPGKNTKNFSVALCKDEEGTFSRKSKFYFVLFYLTLLDKNTEKLMNEKRDSKFTKEKEERG